MGTCSWPRAGTSFFKSFCNCPTPIANPPLTNSTASAYDPVNAAWLQFSQAPVLSQMFASPPPPQIQLVGFSSGAFALALQALIPGVYRVEATTNFSQWNPILTTTNAAGSFQVVDPAAHNYSARF